MSKRSVPLERPESKPRPFYGWYIVTASWLMIFLTNAVAIGIFFKPMLVDFGWDRTTLSLAQSLGLVTYMVASPPLGRLIDRFGPRVMVWICVGTQFVSRLLNAYAGSIWHIYLARATYEVKVVPASQVLVNNWFLRKRGLTQGILASGMPVGTLMLTPVSQFLILAWGWRETMLFWAIVTLVIMVPAALMIRDFPWQKGLAPDGERLEQEVGSVPRGPSRKTGTGAGSLADCMKTRGFWYVSLAHFICGIGCGFVTTHIVIFAIDYGYSDMVAASLVSVQGALNIAGVLVAGHLADRMTGSRVLALTHLARTLSFAVIAVFILKGGGSLLLLYLAMALFGLGWFTTAPLTAGIVADLFGAQRMGTLLGITTSSHILGWSIGGYAGGAIFDTTGSYYLAFLGTTTLSFVATFLALAIGQRRKDAGIPAAAK